MAGEYAVVYWDASAILSVLFKDPHTRVARRWVAREGIHFMSSLAWAEVCAVVSRMKREQVLSALTETGALEAVRQGPWVRMSSLPDWEVSATLCRKWALRGADLWHLAAAKTLQREESDLVLLTFDERLGQCAQGEGMSPGTVPRRSRSK